MAEKKPIYRTYEHTKFKLESLALIDRVNEVLADYAVQGFDMTLRQIYYQLVKANVIPNKDTAYDNLGSLVSKARRAGLVAWNRIEDRTRNLHGYNTWNSPRDIIWTCRHWYNTEKWKMQPVYIEGWIEKEALIGVLERPCRDYEIPFFACRGYVSDSEMWQAAQRAVARAKNNDGQRTVILHMGDHDPSGIDMTRDNQARLDLFGASEYATIERLALNLDQVQERNLPPNPAKLTDSRCADYIRRFGVNESWELDALTPPEIAGLIEDAVTRYRDQVKWDEALALEKTGRDQLVDLYDRWHTAQVGLSDKVVVSDIRATWANYDDTFIEPTDEEIMSIIGKLPENGDEDVFSAVQDVLKEQGRWGGMDD